MQEIDGHCRVKWKEGEEPVIERQIHPDSLIAWVCSVCRKRGLTRKGTVEPVS